MHFRKRRVISLLLSFICLFQVVRFFSLNHPTVEYTVLNEGEHQLWILSEDPWEREYAERAYRSYPKLRDNVCKPPILNPFDNKMVKFFQPFKKNCKGSKEFYFKSYQSIDQSTGKPQYMILLNKKLPPIFCCYEQLRFMTSHPYSRIPSSECLSFARNKTIVPSDTECLIIRCWNDTQPVGPHASVKTDKSPNHEEILFYVRTPNKNLLKKRKQKLANLNKQEDNLNVIILGFDQVSRGNFIRLMRKTFDYLSKDLDAIDMQGYNKIGDATLNNTLAFMTGYDFGAVRNNPNWFNESIPYFDECPWIWKNFSEKGYITAYADDYTSVFNHRFRGFKNSPTDYYSDPLIKWYQKNHKSFGSYDCIGNELALDLLQEHAKKMTVALHNNNPYFNFMWISRIHEKPGYSALADDSTLQTLKYFEDNGVLNRSLVVLLSDHGWRAGDIMMHNQARLENRLSFAFLLLPAWFKKKYSQAYSNISINDHEQRVHINQKYTYNKK